MSVVFNYFKALTLFYSWKEDQLFKIKILFRWIEQSVKVL